MLVIEKMQAGEKEGGMEQGQYMAVPYTLCSTFL